MRPRILVVYYSQTGQLRQILDSVVSEIKGKADIDYAVIEPVIPFPFPWSALQFVDAMPETVTHLPCAVKPLSSEVMNKDYDLIIFGYQPWFLNPSQPTTGFLQTEFARIFAGKPVITVIGCRNMWLHAQENVKKYLKGLGAHLVGNIVLTDTNPNLVSTLTVMRWSFKGQKEASGLLPAAGVQDEDIVAASRFGKTIYQHFVDNNIIDLQRGLLAQGAIALKPGLIILEKRGIKNFRVWAKFIRRKGGPGDPARAGRALMFKNLLLVAIFILSPISNLTAFIQLVMKRNSLLRDVEYFRQLEYQEGRL